MNELDDVKAICKELVIEQEPALLLAVLNKQTAHFADEKDFDKCVSVQAAYMTIVNRQSEALTIDEMRVFYRENLKNEKLTVQDMFTARMIAYEADILADALMKRTMDNQLLHRRFGDVQHKDFYVWNDDQVEAHMRDNIVEIGSRAGEPVYLSSYQMSRNYDQVRKDAVTAVLATGRKNPVDMAPTPYQDANNALEAQDSMAAEQMTANPVASSESRDQVAVTEVKASVEAPNFADTFRAWAKALSEKQVQAAKQ